MFLCRLFFLKLFLKVMYLGGRAVLKMSPHTADTALCQGTAGCEKGSGFAAQRGNALFSVTFVTALSSFAEGH